MKNSSLKTILLENLSEKFLDWTLAKSKSSLYFFDKQFFIFFYLVKGKGWLRDAPTKRRPKTPKVSPQNAPSDARNLHRDAQGRPKDAPKTPYRRPIDAPRTPQRRSRCPKDTPKTHRSGVS